ncbi:hypothetical protein [Blastomonas sp. UPD001]|uniref:hypothetical protein n=1 Tax=Blastomonas sp. UPD001 TaxID=2217673 RepID=UPI000E352700|nr:hypothetical protein [Blastomonas sp. UPD001]
MASTALLAVADRFLVAYTAGDAAAVRALPAPDAVAFYVPWGDTGRSPIAQASVAWSRYPAAFDGFAMSVPRKHEDPSARTAVVATLNEGLQRADVDGIVSRGGTMSCPHLFLIALDEEGLIASVEIWRDQLTLYRQLRIPSGVHAGRSA